MAKNKDGFEAGKPVTNGDLYAYLAKQRSQVSPKPDTDDLSALREEYAEKLGKKPFHGWDAETLTAKMAEHDAPHN